MDGEEEGAESEEEVVVGAAAQRVDRERECGRVRSLESVDLCKKPRSAASAPEEVDGEGGLEEVVGAAAAQRGPGERRECGRTGSLGTAVSSAT